ncbi:Splicing factor Cactin [Caenorhabditis elegans]|uniref:Splicing factor Cactin n=3 Tax=Caenorhabditis elegans TaxID=6239 RepID=CATIN_CAEEL|nr:Splicing factor Cactin [Caenorhabditis elegans]G5EG14.1 RecName: Full=Splicing factor Cactin [Caenorhabditis elegans]CAB76738.2 Splicing factor Cactin [Caenorhabditis elegans]|eukprot:NP_001254422.1 Cactin [Caenorhabditis elegans]
MGKDSKKHKKERRRERSPSTSDSDEERLQKRLAEQRSLKKDEKRRQKEEMKKNESAEEKRARRMEKKMRKDAKRKDADAEDTLIPPELNYTNLNNPFNDTKLTQTFVWGKKLEREGKSGLTQDEITKQTSQRIRKNLHEAAEFKRIRDSRAAAKEDMEMMKRDADLRAGQISDTKEREFQMDQIKERTRIRIDQGRAKAIDLLSRYARFADENPHTAKIPDFELENPMEYLKASCKSVDDYEDLIEDIKTYREVDGWAKNETWWMDVTRIAEDEIQKKAAQNRGDVHASVQTEVQNMFKNKSIDELLKLEDQMDAKIRGNSGNKGYWQDLDDQLKVFIARKRLREHHGRVLRLQLAIIKEEQKKEIQQQESEELLPVAEVPPQVKIQKEEEEEEEEDEDDEKISKKVRRKIDVQTLDDPELDEPERERKWRALTGDQLDDVTRELYRIGCYSPTYISADDTMPGIEILDEQADVDNLTERRNRNRGTLPSSSAASSGAPQGASSKMMAIAREGMEADESIFGAEEQLAAQRHLWSDKYRPRKPTYLNRVQTGFDWNKYNQTHYDQDNPPPKIVQGYKFNIFYPDLLDMTVAPRFGLTSCEDPDFAIIRFKAGPPYEDIAFKVVNREWETLHKNGYKCQFQNGVFQLWFMFKKYRYRR